MEIGDPSDLEIVADVLSRDAVRIQPGNDVLLEHWGGEVPLHGRVRLVGRPDSRNFRLWASKNSGSTW